MNIIYQIEGGLGKSIMGTAVLKALRKKYKKANIIVVSAYPDVFIANPNVNRVLGFDQLADVYRQQIMNKEAKVFVSDPYHTSDFITESQHLIKTWCESYGLEYDGEMPELFLLKAEKEYFEPFYRLDKPILAIQPNGGAVNQPLKYSWTRDIPAPIVEKVIERFKNDYAILHIKRQDQIEYPNTLQALDSFRSIAILLSISQKRLLIDSSAMHVATALKIPSVVTWIGTNPKVFGYDMHNNILANQPTREVNFNHSHYQKHLLYQDISTIPYNNLEEVFDASQIIKALQ